MSLQQWQQLVVWIEGLRLGNGFVHIFQGTNYLVIAFPLESFTMNCFDNKQTYK